MGSHEGDHTRGEPLPSSSDTNAPFQDPDPAPIQAGASEVRTGLRAGGSRIIGGAVVLACLVGVGSLLVEGTVSTALAWSGLLLAIAACAWVLYLHPRVDLLPGGIRLVNPLRTLVLPWSAVTALDMRLGVTLVDTDGGKATAWALPSSGRRTRRTSATTGKVTPEHPEAVSAVLEAFRASRSAGAPGDTPEAPRAEGPSRTSAWNVREVALLALTVLWAVLGFVLR